MLASIRHRRIAAVAAASALVVGCLVVWTNGAASASEPETTPSALVEDFAYPNGTDDPGITLTRGDGHLLKVDCVAGETQIKAVALDDKGGKHNFCFELRGDHGFVEMVLVGAYQVWSDEDHTVTAKYSVDGETGTKTVEPDDLVGIGIGESRDSATLLELRV